MKIVVSVAFAMALASGAAFAQTDIEVTGTPIPATLLQQNYGAVPKDIAAFDLNVCNMTDTKQSVVSSRIYQALAGAQSALQPIGRDIMLAAILRNQTHSVMSILSVALTSATSVVSILGDSRHGLPPAAATGIGLASLSAQQVISSLKPILSADQLEKFESQVLEPALVLDGGSCVERTVFVTVTSAAGAKARAKVEPLSFHIH